MLKFDVCIQAGASVVARMFDSIRELTEYRKANPAHVILSMRGVLA